MGNRREINQKKTVEIDFKLKIYSNISFSNFDQLIYDTFVQMVGGESDSRCARMCQPQFFSLYLLQRIDRLDTESLDSRQQGKSFN